MQTDRSENVHLNEADSAKVETGARRCVLSRTEFPREELIRFVVGPDHSLVADLAEKLPGRGFWVKADRQILEQGLSKGKLQGAISRQVKASVAIAPDMADRIERGLALRLCDFIGLANRAGQIVFGHEKVRDLLRRKGAAALLTAADASEDQTAKLTALAPEVHQIRILRRSELSLALGRENVVHAALKTGGIVRRIEIDAKRLAGFRDLDNQGAGTTGL